MELSHLSEFLPPLRPFLPFPFLLLFFTFGSRTSFPLALAYYPVATTPENVVVELMVELVRYV